jgi:hypothetical protein
MKHRSIIGFVAFLLLLLAGSCTKENRNERRVTGVWVFEKITTETFQNNEMVSSSDTTVDAVLQLLNTNGVENHAYFEGYQPLPSDYCNWDIAYKNPKLIKFYLLNVDAGINFEAYFNIEKLTGRKMILTYYSSDNDLNVNQKITWQLKKER